MTTLSQPYRPAAYVLDRETAPAYWLMGTLWLLTAAGQQTGNVVSMVEQHMPQGPGPASHAHPCDEGFFILEGQITFSCGGETLTLGPGGMLHIPRFCEHTFVIDAGPARVLNYYTPAGNELILMSLGQMAASRTMPSMDAVPPPPPEQAKILAALFGQINVGGRSFVDKPEAANMQTAPAAWTPVPALHALVSEKPARALLGQQWKVLADSTETGGTYSVCEVETPAGFREEAHRDGHDEAIYLLAGRAELTLDGKVSSLQEGAFAFIPAGTVHHFQAPEKTHRLHFFLPGGFEQAVARFGSPISLNSGAEAEAEPAGLATFLRAAGTTFTGPR